MVLIPLVTLIVANQIIHCKINSQAEYPHPHHIHVWNYAKANKDVILSALQNVDWHCLFADKIIYQEVCLLNSFMTDLDK